MTYKSDKMRLSGGSSGSRVNHTFLNHVGRDYLKSHKEEKNEKKKTTEKAKSLSVS